MVFNGARGRRVHDSPDIARKRIEVAARSAKCARGLPFDDGDGGLLAQLPLQTLNHHWWHRWAEQPNVVALGKLPHHIQDAQLRAVVGGVGYEMREHEDVHASSTR